MVIEDYRFESPAGCEKHLNNQSQMVAQEAYLT